MGGGGGGHGSTGSPIAAVLAQYEEHPVVGTWIGDPEPDNPDNPLGLSIVHADGTITAWNLDEGGRGTWAPTGERSVEATVLFPLVDPEAGLLGFTNVSAAKDAVPPTGPGADDDPPTS